MDSEIVRLFVPYSVDTPWIVRREVARVGTFNSRDDAVRAAIAMRSKLARAWGREHPPIQVQDFDGSWREVSDGEPV
jgi:hypothetical protein